MEDGLLNYIMRKCQKRSYLKRPLSLVVHPFRKTKKNWIKQRLPLVCRLWRGEDYSSAERNIANIINPTQVNYQKACMHLNVTVSTKFAMYLIYPSVIIWVLYGIQNYCTHGLSLKMLVQESWYQLLTTAALLLTAWYVMHQWTKLRDSMQYVFFQHKVFMSSDGTTGLHNSAAYYTVMWYV